MPPLFVRRSGGRAESIQDGRRDPITAHGRRRCRRSATLAWCAASGRDPRPASPLCRGAATRRPGAAPPDEPPKLAGAPAPLAALHEQANELLDGGTDAFEAAPREAAGLPGGGEQVGLLVRALPPEFPFFQQQSVKRGEEGRVPRRQLERQRRRREGVPRRLPGAVPELQGPRPGGGRDCKGVQAFPTTAFYDSKGELAYVKQGGYADRGEAGARTSSATLADAGRPAGTHAAQEVDAALGLRERVFCEEQGVATEADRDGLDDEAAPRGGASRRSAWSGTCRRARRRPRARLGPDGGRAGGARAGRRSGDPGRGRPRSARDAGATSHAATRATYVEDLYMAPATRPSGEPFVEEGIPHVSMEKRACLSSGSTRCPGCARSWPASAAGRPGAWLASRRGRRSTPSAIRSSRATRTARRPRCTRCADGGAPTARLARAGGARTSIRPSSPGDPDAVRGPARRRARPARPVLRPPGRRRARGDRQRAAAASSLAELDPEQLETAMGMWRERMRAHAGRRLRARDRQRGHARPARPCRTRTRSSTRSRSFPAAIARERERFTACTNRTQGRNLLEDLVQEEVRLRERVVAIDAEAVALCPYAARVPVPGADRAAPPAAAGSRTTARSARGSCTTSCAG